MVFFFSCQTPGHQDPQDFVLIITIVAWKTIPTLFFFGYIPALLAAPVAIDVIPTAPTAWPIETGSGSKQARI